MSVKLKQKLSQGIMQFTLLICELKPNIKYKIQIRQNNLNWNKFCRARRDPDYTQCEEAECDVLTLGRRAVQLYNMMKGVAITNNK